MDWKINPVRPQAPRGLPRSGRAYPPRHRRRSVHPATLL